MSDERKYRHRGYQDSGDRDRPTRGAPPPHEKKEGPRGRGLGSPTETVFRCNSCGEKRLLTEDLPFDATCTKCGTDLHTCNNCSNFDTSKHWECSKAELIPARVVKKRLRNECPQFTPKATQEFAREADPAKPKPSDARSAFDALFK